ncbi:MAG: hypothetical protein J5871_02910, partial [Bacteroidales bacterium]|nr:hypothetical protein [Bacteroidales bacterium]
QRGFLQDGKEQDYADMHIFPVTYFCPHQTTGEYRRTQDTYCDHKCYGSWMTRPGKVSPLWKFIGKWHLYPLVTLKRKIFK